ncbi:hypothetical protein [Tahibacter amnicola]|uniref:Uncharacterized protein n=1 Tax=Tahibacter amnicola TaxID=2976241 RepID=A0ABY6BLA0_9GAMM|nr:hypothetical protein [Tahibacter amnicola]UXI70562.1 hypothetical protein N4264_13250 [Tahibacter amnicola]
MSATPPDDPRDYQPELARLVAMRDSAITILFITVPAGIVGGLAARYMPAVGIPVDVVAGLTTWYFWSRAVNAPCPRCGERFQGVLRIVLRTLPRVGRCCHCGLECHVPPALG